MALEHFGDDERGRTRVGQFLEWHFDFFNRYRPVKSEDFDPEDHPLIQTRDAPYEGDDELERRLTFLCRRGGEDVNWAYPVTAADTQYQVRIDGGAAFSAA